MKSIFLRLYEKNDYLITNNKMAYEVYKQYDYLTLIGYFLIVKKQSFFPKIKLINI